jgi:SdrD B-like domain
MILNRLCRRGFPIVFACLCGAVTLIATAVHAQQATTQLGGWVYIDRNNDGHLAFADETNPEYVIGDVMISLYSKANNVETLVTSQMTDDFGRYLFTSMPLGTYVLRETQPIEFVDGIDTLGQRLLNNQVIPASSLDGTVSADAFINIDLTTNGVRGEYYNFGERGLKAGYASKRYLLASTPPPNTAAPEPGSALLVLTAICGLLSWRTSRRRCS